MLSLQKILSCSKIIPSGHAKIFKLFQLQSEKTLAKSWIISGLRPRSSTTTNEYNGDTDANLDTDYSEISNQYINPSVSGHNALVIQPYIKWGSKKRKDTTPDLRLAEAEALIRTLPRWSVVDSMCISLMTMQKNKLFGKGNLQMLSEKVRSNNRITAVFISLNLMRPMQIKELQQLLGVPVYDRYSIVIQIFREHAKTTEAKLQVALAELPYIWTKLNWTAEDSGGRINLTESRRMILHSREAKLKNSLQKLKEHRKLIRQNRLSRNIPSVAVVGYTNAGKTCLIKALTGDDSLIPENKLFATLDTTGHEGFLPCRLKVIYMDTIGFIQDIPEGLIEPFIATFEDAILADVIVHVHDASHPDKDAQIQHVRHTLADIMTELETGNKPILDVANKCDLVPSGTVPEDILAVSSVKSFGIDLLRQQIQNELLKATGRTAVKIRVQSGSPPAAWLYKETTVIEAEPDPKNAQYLLMSVIATELQMHKFRKFLKNK